MVEGRGGGRGGVVLVLMELLLVPMLLPLSRVKQYLFPPNSSSIIASFNNVSTFLFSDCYRALLYVACLIFPVILQHRAH